jgi:hypothetical protein
MARLARADVFDPGEVSVFHCIHRCVRRCFLCGHDAESGRDYEHRKAWLEGRLRFLAGCFGIDVLGFAILSNHFHVILRNRPDVVQMWSDAEVARRWLLLCPVRKTPDGEPEEPTDAEIAALTGLPEKLAEIRLRLSDISWFMKLAAEPIARRANQEDRVTGHFWEGRFKSVKLCDEAAILACGVYVDLNVIRAGLAQTPEESDFTSAQRRIEALAGQGNEARGEQRATSESSPAASPDDWLAPLALDEATASPGPAPSECPARCSDRGFLPMSLEDYLDLLDWTGRQFACDKRGAIPPHLAPILARLKIAEDNWLELAENFGRLFQRVAGRPRSIARLRTRRGGVFRPGCARLLGPVSRAS